MNAETAYRLHWADIVTEKKQSVSEAEGLIRHISSKYGQFDRSRIKEYLASYLEERRSTI